MSVYAIVNVGVIIAENLLYAIGCDSKGICSLNDINKIST